jgi:hypothetical protein
VRSPLIARDCQCLSLIENDGPVHPEAIGVVPGRGAPQTEGVALPSMHVLITTRALPTGAPVADIDEWLAALNAFARKEVNAWSADVDEVARTGKGAEWAGRHDRTGFGFFDRPGGLKATDGH